jgi:gliding motility-associated-like protein
MKRILLQCLFLSLLLVGAYQVSGQNTCLDNWRYTRAISIRNSGFGLLNDWQVRVSVNTQALIAAGKMNADGSDIRFTSGDCCTQLPYWIQSGLNTPTTFIWTRVPQLASFDTTWIQMYYGNPAATTIQSNIDLVHFAIGNDSMGTDTAKPGRTYATQELTFPFNARTVRFRLYSADTMRIKFKVTNDTNMVTGTSPFFNVPSATGFHDFDAAMVASSGGHPGWFTNTGGSFMNYCTPVIPCPGSCGDAVSKIGDNGVFGALKTDSCGLVPSMKVWFRRSAFSDPQSNSSWAEFDRMQPFGAISPSGTSMCFNDSLPLTVPKLNALSYQWFRNGLLVPGATDTTIQARLDGSYHCVADFGVACQVISSDTIAVAYNTPSLDLGPDISVCSDTGYTIQAQTIFQTYLWNDGSTLTSLHVDTTGSYWLSVADSFACVDSDTVFVTLHPLPVPVITVTGPTSVCPGSSVALTALDPAWYAYQWIPNNETSANINASSTGDYAVIVWDEFFCSDTSASVTVTTFPDPVLNLDSLTTFCIGDSATLDAGTGWASIVWPNGSTGQTFTVDATGFYVASVIDSNGCATLDTAAVLVFNNPTVNIGLNDTICPAATTTLTAGLTFATYAWNNGGTSPSVVVGPGVYNVAVTDSNGCSGLSNLVYISAFPLLAAPVVSGTSAGLTSTNAPNYQWYFNGVAISGATSQTYKPTATGFYSLGVADVNGCLNVLSNSVEIVLDITADDIPEGFSPNGDGINDFFIIQRIESFAASSLVIMNRWGSTVYTKKPYDNTFNGLSSNGKDLPDGTYFYLLDLGTGLKFQDYLIINR